MARSYGELQREQDGGVRCEGTLQRNKYLCSNCRPSHSPCSHSTSARSNDPVALEQRKMEVCLIGLRPIAMSAPGNASSEECNHQLTHAKPTRKYTLATGCEDGMGKYGNLWFAMRAHHAILLETRTVQTTVLDCFDSLFPPPASERSRNATSTILRICLCAAHRLCIVEGWGHKSIGCSLEGTSPESRCCWSRVASSCPADSPKGQYEEAKASVCRSVSGKITQGRFTKGPRVCRLPACSGSIRLALFGLALQSLFRWMV